MTQERSLASVGSAVGVELSPGSGLGYGVELLSSPTNSLAAAVVYRTGGTRASGRTDPPPAFSVGLTRTDDDVLSASVW